MLYTLIGAALADPLVQSAEDDQDDDPSWGLPDEPRDEGIINGEVETDFPSAVGLGFVGQILCSGSLITPRMVLTAAHCSAGYPIELLAEFGVAYVGSEATAPKDELAFVGGEIHPDYRPLSGAYLGENDVAVLVLEKDARQQPVWFRTEPLKPREAEGEQVISVGWGLDEFDLAGTKRSAPLIVAELDPVFLVSYSVQNDKGANVCSGDSGGPQYHVEDDGRLVQWAVHSWADLECRFQSGSTRTDTVSDWILERVLEEHGTTDQCAIYGYYGDGTCHEFCDSYDVDCMEIIPEYALLDAANAKGCGCSSSGGAGWLVTGVPLVLALRRRGSPTRSRHTMPR